MSRRIVPVTFWVGMLSCAVLLLEPWARASGPPARVPNLQGPWDGFIQGGLGLAQADITGQDHQRIEGQVDLVGLTQFFDFRGTVSDNVIAGAGRTATGRVVVRGGIETFEGVTGDAVVWHPEFRFVPVRGRATQVGATLLHPFPDVTTTNIAGRTAGPFVGQTNRAFSGYGIMDLLPPDRGGFPGTFHFIPASTADSQLGFSWPVRATASATGQFIMIGQGKTGGMTYIGSVITSQDGSPTKIWGIARLLFNNGHVLYNTFNANLTAATP